MHSIGNSNLPEQKYTLKDIISKYILNDIT